MKKSSRMAGLIASALLVAVAAASCGSNSSSATANNSVAPASSADTGTSSAAASSSAIDNSQFVTVSMYNFGDPSNDSWKTVQSAINDYLKNSTSLNCALSLQYMTWTNWQTNYATLLASGKPIDIVNTASDWLNLWQNAQKGAFTDLTDLLPTYAPDLWAGTSQADWNACKYNGKIVCTPEDAYTQWVNHGFGYRGDWAQAAGIGDSNGQITTWDQITQYLAWVKANKPGVIPWDAGAGNGDTITGWLTSTTDTVQMAAATTDPAVWSTKSATDTTVVCPYTDPTYTDTLVQWAQLMQTWQKNGYIPTDVLNNNDAGDQQMIKSGKSGMFQHHVQTYRGMKLHFDTVDQPGANLEFFGWWVPSGNLTKMSVTHGASAIGAKSANPGRALQILNLIYTDQKFYMLLNYGILNQTYFLNDQGQMYTPTTFDSTKSGYGADFWGGRLDKFEPVNVNDVGWKGTYGSFADMSAALAQIAKPLPFDGCPFDLTSVQKYVDAVQQVITNDEPTFAWGKEADAAASVAKFSADLKAAGVDQVTAVLQQELDAWKAQQSSGN